MTQFLVRDTTGDTMLELQCCKPILMDVVNIKVKGGKKSVCGNKFFFGGEELTVNFIGLRPGIHGS